MTAETCVYQFDPAAHDGSTSLTERWSCPHAAHESGEYCPFHMPPNDREAAGIGPETVTEAFLEAADTEGRRRKQFVGARFEAPELTYVIVDAADKYPVDLRHASIDGTFTMEAVEFGQPLDLRHAELNAIEWHDSALGERCDLADATIDGRFDATGTTFEDRLDFSDVRFDGPVSFDEARCRGDACLKRTEFAAEASFDGAEFHGEANLLADDACFEETVFHEPASFRKAEFRYADFVDCAFEGEAVFDEATFTGDGEFRGAVFGDDASFQGADFHGDADVLIDDADFSATTFHGTANFYRADFTLANFEGAAFESEAEFVDAAFDADALFTDARFADEATFTEARFRQDTDFSGVSIDGEAVFRGAEFQGGDNSEDDDVTFAGATFGDHADFSHAQFRLGTFNDATFESDAIFRKAVFGRDAQFPGVHVTGTFDGVEARFNGDTSFTDAEFGDDLVLRGVEFHGEDNVTDDDVTFEDAVVDGHADFTRGEFGYANFAKAAFGGEASFPDAAFEHDAGFSDCRFEGPVSFHGAAFEGGSDRVAAAGFEDAVFADDVTFARLECADGVFDGVRIEGEATFERANFETLEVANGCFEEPVDFTFVDYAGPSTFQGTTFEATVEFDEGRFDSDVCFAGVDFEAPVTFHGAEFRGGAYTIDDADFEGAHFGADAGFEMASFRYANFIDATFEGEAGFSDVDFTDQADFVDAAFEASATFKGSVFSDAVDFAGSRFDGESVFAETVFDDAVSFDGATFRERATFRGAEFAAGADVHSDDIDFGNATFQAEADFSRTAFQCASFSATAFSGIADFTGATFSETLRMRPRCLDGETIVDFRDATIRAGTIGQPEQGDVFYDVTEGELGDVRLDPENCRHPLFDHFRLCNTDFDGFDFTTHKPHLAENDWLIHTFAADTDDDMNTAELENTYLKAKNAASEFGDRKAASEFFIKEMIYRRKKHFAIASGRAVGAATNIPVVTRLKALGKWAGNNVLYQTCGYGERLWRIVYVSFVAIFFWATLYTVMPWSRQGDTLASVDSFGALTSSTGLLAFIENLYFSTATFITLEYVNSPAATTARWAASLEAYFGALLIALVVFVLGRRVAW